MREKRKCSRCGKVDSGQPTARVVIGTHRAAAKYVGKCQECGELFCGDCASRQFDLYVDSATKLENAHSIGLQAAIQMISGREAREVIEEVYENDGTELVLSYRCPTCFGQLEF